MSKDLEKSIEGLIATLRSVKEWSEHVLSDVESKLVKFQSGRAELDKALVALQEERAKFINETSAEVSAETSHALDILSKRMEELLAGRPRVEVVTPPAAAPVPTPMPAEAQAAPVPQPASRNTKATTPLPDEVTETAAA